MMFMSHLLLLLFLSLLLLLLNFLLHRQLTRRPYPPPNISHTTVVSGCAGVPDDEPSVASSAVEGVFLDVGLGEG